MSLPRPDLIAPTPYETWVLTLRAWAAEPMTPLDHLPALEDDTYTPDTYRMLFDHVRAALDAATDRWMNELHRAMTTFNDPHELAQALVALRSSLARRVQLATHPSLPPAVRDGLREGVQRSIERYQREFEEGIEDSLRRSLRDRAWQEAIRRTVRENSFTRTLDMSITQTGERQTVAPLPEISNQAPINPSPRYTRRLIL